MAHTINKGESRGASSWLQLGSVGSWCPCARVRAATEADAGQLRRTIDFKCSNSSGWLLSSSSQWEGGGSWELYRPPLAANIAWLGRVVTSLWPQAGGLLGTSIVYLWRFMEKPANIRLWSRTQVSALPCMEDSGRRFGWSRMMSFPLWFPSVFQPWAWPGRRSKGEACMASGYIHASSERKRDTGTFCGISYGGERPR